MVSDFPYRKELLLKERICSLREKIIIPFKRSSHFEKGAQLMTNIACSSSLPLMFITF